jgi:uncharacterized protein
MWRLKQALMETSKTTTCARLIFDRGGHGPYYTRPMVASLPDLVDCARLAEERATLERVYELGELPRLKDLLAEPRGILRASFDFAKLASGRPGAEVTVHATPLLVCQRCMQGFALSATGDSEIEFAAGEEPQDADSERESFRMRNGLVSLRELAEEELLLALPHAFMCSTPLTCGNAPSYATDGETGDLVDDPAEDNMRRPFSALKSLLKKT